MPDGFADRDRQPAEPLQPPRGVAAAVHAVHTADRQQPRPGVASDQHAEPIAAHQQPPFVGDGKRGRAQVQAPMHAQGILFGLLPERVTVPQPAQLAVPIEVARQFAQVRQELQGGLLRRERNGGRQQQFEYGHDFAFAAQRAEQQHEFARIPGLAALGQARTGRHAARLTGLQDGRRQQAMWPHAGGVGQRTAAGQEQLVLQVQRVVRPHRPHQPAGGCRRLHGAFQQPLLKLGGRHLAAGQVGDFCDQAIQFAERRFAVSGMSQGSVLLHVVSLSAAADERQAPGTREASWWVPGANGTRPSLDAKPPGEVLRQAAFPKAGLFAGGASRVGKFCGLFRLCGKCRFFGPQLADDRTTKGPDVGNP